MRTLIIDTSNNKEISVGLKIDGKEIIERQNLDKTKAQAALPMIEKILNKNRLELKDLQSIKVNTGPGSFTGLRVGIAIANALGFFLGIPVNNKKKGELEEPIYS